MGNPSNEFRVLENEVNNIKEDIKEIKADNKETKKYHRETIDALKENILLQTQIMSNQQQQTEYQFKDLNKDVLSVKEDMTELKANVSTSINSQTKWYQNFITDNGKIVWKIIFFIIIVLSGLKLANIDVIKLLSGL